MIEKVLPARRHCSLDPLLTRKQIPTFESFAGADAAIFVELDGQPSFSLESIR